MAKIKAAITGTPMLDPLAVLLDGREFCHTLMGAVLRDCFHVQDPEQRPAEYYVQRTDRTIEVTDGVYGMEVRITGVSVTPERSDADFHQALAATVNAYAVAIKATVAKGMRVQLFVALMVDGVVRNQLGAHVSVLESDAIWVEGEV